VDQETLTAEARPRTGAQGPVVVGFVCVWSVGLDGLVDERGRLRAFPSVQVISVPCSGFVRPNWLEEALRLGAAGAFVTGCPYGDCLNREGNYLMRDRVEQLERRLQRRRVEPARVAMLAHGLHEQAGFLEAVGAFLRRLEALGPAAPTARPGGAGAAPTARARPGGAAPAARPAPASEPAEEEGT